MKQHKAAPTNNTATQFVNLANHYVSYDVVEDNNSWALSLSAVNIDCASNLMAHDLTIELLDSHYQPLPLLQISPTTGPLPAITFKAVSSYFMLAHFAKTQVPAAYLSLGLLGCHVVTELRLTHAKPSHTGQQQDPNFIGYYQDQAIFCAPPAPPPPPAKCCCVASFTPPNGNLPVNTTQATGRIYLFPDPWIIRATFTDNNNCACNACEYRQEIKGQITAQQPGFIALPVQGLPPLNFKPPQQPGGKPQPVYIDPNQFQLDTIGDAANPGSFKAAYGYKPSKNPGMESYKNSGCSYWCLDSPSTHFGVAAAPKGTIISIDITFKGYFEDIACTGRKNEQTWKWVQSYTV
ncbi:hypothetical protein NO559_14150 [Dasania sp. GY-MA-18]|uniref:Uncharacterized protein n=1 Tax=Dasania phycosphaerae TaxID=2950436 RepID=A0A9J6RP77_9GAMM|nr:MULTISPECIES: hypothetical protein [Dasania]MCR8923921.1 hypothetical protein [Dasania sp. GY-MA-18]MCZ0866355.1 hypothetical protein [Dasania phycosphaerae]MCZ0870079.1 hypothetical protein [Dasania phycosphaerae]